MRHSHRQECRNLETNSLQNLDSQFVKTLFYENRVLRQPVLPSVQTKSLTVKPVVFDREEQPLCGDPEQVTTCRSHSPDFCLQFGLDYLRRVGNFLGVTNKWLIISRKV